MLGSAVCLLLLIVAAIRKRPKKKLVISFIVCFVLFCGAIGMSDPDTQTADDPPDSSESLSVNTPPVQEAKRGALSFPASEQPDKQTEAPAPTNTAPLIVDFPPAPSPTPEVTPTLEPVPTPTPKATPTSTAKPTPKPTFTPEPKPTPTPTTKPVQAEPAHTPNAQATLNVASTGNGQGGSTQSAHNSGGDANNFNTYDNEQQQQTSDQWVLNTNTMKIHYPSCSSVSRIAPGNYDTSNASESELLAQGYTVCGRCH